MIRAAEGGGGGKETCVQQHSARACYTRYFPLLPHRRIRIRARIRTPTHAGKDRTPTDPCTYVHTYIRKCNQRRKKGFVNQRSHRQRRIADLPRRHATDPSPPSQPTARTHAYIHTYAEKDREREGERDSSAPIYPARQKQTPIYETDAWHDSNMYDIVANDGSHLKLLLGLRAEHRGCRRYATRSAPHRENALSL